MIPVRCFTCNKVLGNKHDTFCALKDADVPYEEIWKRLGLTRTCCKMIMRTYVDLTDKLMVYQDYDPCQYIEIRKHCISDKPRVYNAI